MAFDEAARAKALAKRRENKARREAAKAKAEAKVEVPRGAIAPQQEASPPPEVSASDPSVNIPVPDPSKPETIPTNYLSGFVKRLEVHGDRPGFTRRWFNDDKGGSNIRAALQSGWTFAERTDVQLNAAVTPRNTDLGSRVQECVGTNENGSALFAFLMEIPTWLFEKHKEAREAYNRQLMAQIRGGAIGAKSGDGRYSAANPPPGGTTLPGITVDQKLYR